MPNTNKQNRLSTESSPYLLQHARDPVDWHPWGKEALQLAEKENKPIFLSIGYSACHWCHVMAHESFSDEATAQVLNQQFVSIKVDREERPDLDKIYQNAFQLLNGQSGGWPLTMVLTPDDQIPFFGATYLAKEGRNGFPGFADLMQRLADYYHSNEAEVRQQNSGLSEALKAGPSRHGRTGFSLNVQPLEEVVARLKDSFDATHGGFGEAPKFPQPLSIERLLRHYYHTQQHTDETDTRAGFIAKYSLEKMAQGGVYDQIGGGFFRYAVDQQWQIPHFEKMLYDNAQLLALYSQAWQLTHTPRFKTIAEDIAAWALREMLAPQGGFYASLDADSEDTDDTKTEGAFYLWTPDQMEACLKPEEFAVYQRFYGLEESANFSGRWHLCSTGPGQNEQEQELLLSARQKLLKVRNQRPRPGRDEKILCAWNALMIKGLASAGRHFQRQDLIEQAQRTLDFIREKMWQHGRLFAVYKDDQAKCSAYIDDYALLIDAILELLQCRWRDGDLNFALELAEVLMNRFQDPKKQGGFYFTADDHETLIQRPKPLFDDVLPAGNGVTAQVLIKLGHLTNSIHYLVAAERALKNAWPSIDRNPVGCSAMLLALEEYYYPSQIVVIRGASEDTKIWQQRCTKHYSPRRLTVAIPNDAAMLPEFLALREAQDTVVAYICDGAKCSAPITDLQQLEQALLSESSIPMAPKENVSGRSVH